MLQSPFKYYCLWSHWFYFIASQNGLGWRNFKDNFVPTLPTTGRDAIQRCIQSKYFPEFLNSSFPQNYIDGPTTNWIHFISSIQMTNTTKVLCPESMEIKLCAINYQSRREFTSGKCCAANWMVIINIFQEPKSIYFQ